MSTANFYQLMGAEPKQLQFLRDSLVYRYLLFGGARGPGKSYLLRWGLVWRLMRWDAQGLKNVRVALCSEDYPTLRDRQISKIQTEFPPWLGDLKTTQANGLGFYLKPKWGGGIICLRNLDDPGQFVGGEFAGLAVEELTRHPDPTTFNQIRGSIRWPGTDRQNVDDTFFWAVTNPFGPGLVWVRKYWIEHEFPPEMQELSPEFHFIQGLPSDNSHLGADYWADLRSQPPHIQKAWIDGDWYVIAGVMFEELQQSIHQVPDAPPSDRTSKMIAMDWGWQHDATAVWVETGSGVNGAPKSRAYRELAMNQTPAHLFAAEVVRLSGDDGVKRVVMDSAAMQGGDPSAPFQQMLPVFHAAGMTLEPAVKGPKSREHGWQLLHTYFYPRAKTGPLLTISKQCKHLWTQLTSLQVDEKSGEDTRKDQRDDVATALRYWAQAMPEPPKPTAEELRQVDPEGKALDDPMTAAVIRDSRNKAKWTPKIRPDDPKPVKPLRSPYDIRRLVR